MPENEQNSDLVLGLTIMGLMNALDVILFYTAAVAYKAVPGEWIDRLEAQAIHAVKNQIVNGLPMTQDAMGTANAIAILEERFATLRRRLTDPNHPG